MMHLPFKACSSVKSGQRLAWLLLLLVTPTAAAQWSTAQLSEPRSYLAATAHGTRAFFAGGESGPNQFSDVVDIYDTATDTWSTAHLAQARSRIAATTVGGKMMFAGGHLGSAKSDVVDIYDTTTGSWSTHTLSVPRSELVACSNGTTAIFAGGSTAYATSTSAIDVYDSVTDSWSTGNLTTARYGMGAAVLGDLAVICSGVLDGYTYLTSVETYDLSDGQLTLLPGSVSGRAAPCGAAIGDLALFAGGTSPTAPVSLIETYDGFSGLWSTDNLSVARRDLTSTVLGDRVFFAGGETAGGGLASPTDVVDIYDTGSATWSLANLSQARSTLAATTVCSMAMFAGGWDGSAPSDVVDLFSEVRLDSVTPSRGRYDSGLTATLGGSGFSLGPVQVEFNGNAAADVTVLDDTSLTCTIPLGDPGTADVDVTVLVGAARSTLENAFAYTPAIQRAGDLVPGGSVTIQYLCDPGDSILCIHGLPPQQSIHIPNFDGVLAIQPFAIAFVAPAWPRDTFILLLDIPDDPQLVGVVLLLQALIGPSFQPPRNGAWTNCVSLSIE